MQGQKRPKVLLQVQTHDSGTGLSLTLSETLVRKGSTAFSGLRV